MKSRVPRPIYVILWLTGVVLLFLGFAALSFSAGAKWPSAAFVAMAGYSVFVSRNEILKVEVHADGFKVRRLWGTSLYPFEAVRYIARDEVGRRYSNLPTVRVDFRSGLSIQLPAFPENRDQLYDQLLAAWQNVPPVRRL